MNWERHNGALKKEREGEKMIFMSTVDPLYPRGDPSALHSNGSTPPPFPNPEVLWGGRGRISSVRNCHQSWLIPFLPWGNLSGFSASVPPSIHPSIHPSVHPSICLSIILLPGQVQPPRQSVTVKIIKITAKKIPKMYLMNDHTAALIPHFV